MSSPSGLSGCSQRSRPRKPPVAGVERLARLRFTRLAAIRSLRSRIPRCAPRRCTPVVIASAVFLQRPAPFSPARRHDNEPHPPQPTHALTPFGRSSLAQRRLVTEDEPARATLENSQTETQPRSDHVAPRPTSRWRTSRGRVPALAPARRRSTRPLPRRPTPAARPRSRSRPRPGSSPRSR